MKIVLWKFQGVMTFGKNIRRLWKIDGIWRFLKNLEE